MSVYCHVDKWSVCPMEQEDTIMDIFEWSKSNFDDKDLELAYPSPCMPISMWKKQEKKKVEIKKEFY